MMKRVNFSIDEATQQRLIDLEPHYRHSKSAVIRAAVEELHARLLRQQQQEKEKDK